MPGTVREEQGRSRLRAAWVRAIDDNNVASGKVASGPRADIQSADPYKASNYVDIREGKEYFPTRQELLAANYPENYIVAFELWAQQAPADVKQKSDANRAAAKDTRWSEVVTLPAPTTLSNRTPSNLSLFKIVVAVTVIRSRTTVIGCRLGQERQPKLNNDQATAHAKSTPRGTLNFCQRSYSWLGINQITNA